MIFIHMFLALFIDIDLVKLNHHSSQFSGQHKIRCGIVALACLFNLILYVPVNNLFAMSGLVFLV